MKASSIRIDWYHVPVLLFFMLVLGCTTKNINKRKVFTKPDTIQGPISVPAGIPSRTLLDASAPTRKMAPTILNSQNGNQMPLKTSSSDFFINIENFDTEEGLALSTVLCGMKDRDGQMWFGTSGNGVSKYDGQAFKTYNSSHGLIHNLITDIFQDDQGMIWFGTYGGLSRYDGNEFINYTKNEGLIDNNIYSLTEDQDGNLWIGTANGLSKFDGQTFENFSINAGLSSTSILDILIDDQNNLIVATVEGLFLYKKSNQGDVDRSILPYSTSETLIDEAVTSVHKDSKGILWLGTDYGLIKYDPTNSKGEGDAFIRLTSNDGLVNDRIRCITKDSKGFLWIGTETGISRYDPKGDTNGKNLFSNLTTAHGLSNNVINKITEDRSGSLWFSTGGGGLDKYDGDGVISYSADQGLPLTAVSAMTAIDNDQLLFADFEGSMSIFNGEGFSSYPFEDELDMYFVWDAYTDPESDLWLATSNGVFWYDGRSTTHFTEDQGLLSNEIVSIGQDKEGSIWMGTYEAGINKFNGHEISGYTVEEGLVHNTVWSILQDSDGIMWFATRGGLSRFDGDTFLNFTKAQGLVENKLSTIIQDSQGNLLIGSWGSGVSILRKENLEKLTAQHDSSRSLSYFESFTTSEGLSNDVVYDIEEDSHGNIFIGSSTGITVLKGGLDPTGENIAIDGVENYNQKTGYHIKDINNQNAMIMDKNDVLWAGTSDGLVRFDYQKLTRNKEVPNIFIQNVAINKQTLSWRLLLEARKREFNKPNLSGYVQPFVSDELHVYGRKLVDEERDSVVEQFEDVRFDDVRPFYDVPEQLVLPYSQNTIGLDFLSVETSRPSLVHYQYKLEGYEEHWSPITSQPSATYGNLPEGSYTFLVKAQSPQNIWSEPISYSFKILPPWYRSLLAYLIYILLAVVSIMLVHRFQKMRLLHKERNRTMQRELAQAKEIEKAYANLQATQTQLIHSEKMASLGELTAGIAHEIQNPLNFVNNFSEINREMIEELKEAVSNNDLEEINALLVDLGDNEQKVTHHGKRAEQIVKSMLQHSRTGSGEKELTDINALCDEYLRLSYHGLRAKDPSFNADYKLELHPTLPKTRIIPQEIGRVLLNLINNAFQATKDTENALVTVSTKFIHLRKGVTGQEKIMLTISDNGPGIPDDIKEKIFQPFFTTKPTGEGTGLGLSMSYDIVTKGHGGNLDVKSEEGKGSEFTVSLPIV